MATKGTAKPTKQDSLVALLKRPTGATLDELCKKTGWQPHSVRGAIAGTVKKKLGLAVESSVNDGKRTYRIIDKAA